jgi:opacity protein-like surface antigen
LRIGFHHAYLGPFQRRAPLVVPFSKGDTVTRIAKLFRFLPALVLALAPATASADGWVSGSVGTVFGGAAGSGFSQAVENQSKTTYGFTVGGMGGGIFGAELDLGYTPKFFGSDASVSSSGVLTATGNLLIGVPIGGQSGPGIRPYGTIGIGLLRRNIEFQEGLAKIDSNDFGYTLGGGVMGFFSDNFGIRGDYRYYRNFTKDDNLDGGFLGFDTGTFNFSRASVGIVIRF